jgi:hypothetical protein
MSAGHLFRVLCQKKPSFCPKIAYSAWQGYCVLAILSVKSEEFPTVMPKNSRFIGNLFASFSRFLENIHKLAQTGLQRGST